MNKRIKCYATFRSMNKVYDEDLAEYMSRVMREKKLKNRDIEIRSGNRISNGYVSKLLNRENRNPTVDSLMALADGLGVRVEDVVTAAFGKKIRITVETLDGDIAQITSLWRMIPDQIKIEITPTFAMLRLYIEDKIKHNPFIHPVPQLPDASPSPGPPDIAANPVPIEKAVEKKTQRTSRTKKSRKSSD